MVYTLIMSLEHLKAPLHGSTGNPLNFQEGPCTLLLSKV